MASSGLQSTTLFSVRATLRDELASSGRTAADAFHGIDTNRSGSIDESQFATFVQAAVDHVNKSPGEDKLVVTPELVTGMFRALDSDGDGGIAMREFTTPDDGCTHLAKRARLAADHAAAVEENRTGMHNPSSTLAPARPSLDCSANTTTAVAASMAFLVVVATGANVLFHTNTSSHTHHQHGSTRTRFQIIVNYYE